MASEHTQLKEELLVVRQDNIQLVREHNHVKQACEELRRLHDEDQREVADMRMLHQQVFVQLAVFIYAHTRTDVRTDAIERMKRGILFAHTSTQTIISIRGCP